MELEFFSGDFQPLRYRPGGVGNWSGHLPFAADLTAAVRPNLFVELGTHYGESYFGFCQAVREKNVPCSCYAVDTWVGEPHAGFYSEEVYDDVNAYNSAHYSDFSYLLRTTFDEATEKFADESIDVLHIDGLHSYQAVTHDLRSWLKKVKPGGIVLMHDVMVRHTDFGVWRVWDELASDGKQFVFRHSWGLGVFRKPGSAVPDNGLFKILFDSPPETREHARKFYALCATKLEREHEVLHRHQGTERGVVSEIYPFGSTGYNANTAIKVDLEQGRWTHRSISVLQGLGYGPLRIDPVDQPALIDVSGILLRRPTDGEIVWSAKGFDDVAALSLGGTIIGVTSTDTEFCRFFSYGSDPQLFLPLLDSKRFDQPLILELWLRVQTDMASLLPVLQGADQQRSQVQALESALGDAAHQRSRIETLESALRDADQQLHRIQILESALQAREAAASDQQSLRSEVNKLKQELTELQQQCNTLEGERDALAATLRRVQSDLYVSKTDLRHRAAEEERLRSELAAQKQQTANSERVLHEALSSRSWRITDPIRKLSKAFGTQR